MNVAIRTFGLSAYILASAYFGVAQVKAASVSAGSHAPLVFYATSRGGETLDQGDGGGNPFASSLIDLLGRPTLNLSGLSSELTTLTYQKSHGYQTPEVPALTSSMSWNLKPITQGERRVALVIGISDYGAASELAHPPRVPRHH